MGAWMSSPSACALGALGAMHGALACTAAFAPKALFSAFGREVNFSESAEGEALLGLTHILAAASATFAFLFLHYISMPDKHQGGLRTAQMLSALYAIASAVRLYNSKSEATTAVAQKNLTVQLAALAVAVHGLKYAPKPKES